ncbi:hypothetical protein pb186bvf_010411 [Paramecium bursaria]
MKSIKRKFQSVKNIKKAPKQRSSELNSFQNIVSTIMRISMIIKIIEIQFIIFLLNFLIRRINYD